MIEEESIVRGRLTLRPDPRASGRHAFVEPAAPMALEEYERELAATRPDWRHAWPV
jgi:hypothetical protein